jgi:hypothetical protein
MNQCIFKVILITVGFFLVDGSGYGQIDSKIYMENKV